MKKDDKFETGLADSQATPVESMKPDQFDIAAYEDYEQQLLERCSDFWQSDSGILVYRRMRVAEVFSFDSRDMRKSLEWQLGALTQSVKYKADVPNFLEPWYGIGTIASAFGKDYAWHPGQAPAITGKFSTLKEALEYDYSPVHQTPIGKHTLEMIEYFLDKTGGRIPMSFCDMQSPLNIAENIVDINSLMTDFLLDPDSLKQLFAIITELMIDFNRRQKELIGNALVSPGHGFASARSFEGLGMSDDIFIMLSDDLYQDIAMPCFERTASALGSAAFHSCGNWSHKIDLVKKIKGLKMIDAAFSKATDPDANPVEPFATAFDNSGIVVNARIVGLHDTVEEKVKKLWRPGMKLILVTYCKTPAEQEQIYNRIHEICKS